MDDIDVYPNQASTYLMLASKNNESLRYEIIDICGKVILNGSISTPLERVDIGSIVDGVYMLRCFNMDGFGKSTLFIKKSNGK